MKKTVIINPTREDMEGAVSLDPSQLKKAIFEKALRTTESDFRPMLFRTSNLSLLIGNIEPKVVAASPYIDRQLDSFQEASEYLGSVASEIYGPDWAMTVLKNEVMFNRAEKFVMRVDSEETVQRVRDLLESIAIVQIKEARKPKAKQKKEEEKEESNEQQS